MNPPDTRRASSPYRQVAGVVAGAALLAVLALAGAPAHAHPGGVAADGCHVDRKTGDCHCHPESATGQPGCQGMEPAGTPPVPEGYLRIATWNLNGLHWRTGERMFDWTPARTDEDYDTLADYARRLNADIIALQEVNGPRAAKRVFPPRDYFLLFSGRYNPQKDDIYTGFAINKRRFDPDEVARRDYRGLSLGKKSRLRWGLDLEIPWKGRTLRLLNVHLKAGCNKEQSLRNPAPKSDCDKLARQIEPLEEWIDERWREGTPFVVLGDFNREFDRHGEHDHLWSDINDGKPSGLQLHRLPPPGRTRPCWRGTKLQHRYRHPVDFFVFGARAWQRVDKASLREVRWDREDADTKRKLPSDHCPIAVDLF